MTADSPQLSAALAASIFAQGRVDRYAAANEAKTAAWNAAHPVGTLVRYWRGIRDGDPSGTGRTRSQAWTLGGHTPVVLIDGTSGCIALTHVEILADAQAASESDDGNVRGVA